MKQLSYVKKKSLNSSTLYDKEEYNIFRNYDMLLKKYNLPSLDKIPFSRPVGTIVSFSKFTKKNTKTKGEAMAMGTIENENISYRFVMFPKDLSKLRIDIKTNTLYIINGILKDDNKNEKNFIVDGIYEIKQNQG